MRFSYFFPPKLKNHFFSSQNQIVANLFFCYFFCIFAPVFFNKTILGSGLKKNLCLFLLLLLVFTPIFAEQVEEAEEKSDLGEIIRLKVVNMADLHGNFLTYDHIRKRPAIGGLPYVHAYIKEQRRDTTQHVILFNGGDVLQGQFAAYFYNYLDTREKFMPTVFFNLAGVDASVMGNHDLEPGMDTYAQFIRSTGALRTEMLGANVVRTGVRTRYLKPYTMLRRGGLRIAVLGLLTPIQLNCAKTQIVERLDILDMFEPARYWVDRIQRTEAPDLIFGLFHAGFIDNDRGLDPNVSDCIKHNDPMYIARNVPGFDAIFMGNFHRLLKDSVHVDGRTVWLLEGGHGGANLGVLDLEVQKIPGQRATILNAVPSIKSTVDIELTEDIFDDLPIREEEALIATYAERFVATLKDTIFNIEAYFGSNFFVDLAHKAQLDHTEAEVSFAAPLSSNAVIAAGDLTYADMLRVYRFENQCMVFRMSGREIKNYLEYSYGLWINQMHSPDDRLLRTRDDGNSFQRFEIPQFNFDSGAGLDYEVDVRKPAGERITILRMWSDRPFHEDSTYSVVTPAYRFFGAGGHMKLGAGIPHEELQSRIIHHDHRQIRELIHQDFIRQGEIRAFQFNNWRFVPEHYAIPAREREIGDLR